MASQQHTYVDGQVFSAADFNDELNQLYTNLTNSNIASGAAIARSKLAASDIASVSGSVGLVTSTSFISTGLGVSIAPLWTKVLVTLTGDVANDTIGDGVGIAIFRNTTGIPTLNASVGSDTKLWEFDTTQEGLANNPQAVSATVLNVGLTAGTTYYFYIGLKAKSGGNASFSYGQAGGSGGYMAAESR